MALIKHCLNCITGWTTDSLLDWGQFIKLAVSGMVMICIEWWSFELGAFFAGIVKTYHNQNDSI